MPKEETLITSFRFRVSCSSAYCDFIERIFLQLNLYAACTNWYVDASPRKIHISVASFHFTIEGKEESTGDQFQLIISNMKLVHNDDLKTSDKYVMFDCLYRWCKDTHVHRFLVNAEKRWNACIEDTSFT
jgi:hypothetical protein